MHRSRPRAFALAAAALAVLSLAACSSAPEQPILNQFFTASRLRDNTSLQNFATVSFDPRIQGTVTRFSITAVSPEQRTALNVKALAQAVEDVKLEDDAYNKRKREYYNANEEAVSRALKAERENARLKGKDADVQAAWTKFRDEGTLLSRKIADAKSKLAAESGLVDISFSDVRGAPDYKKNDADLVSKAVTLSASVKLPNGQSQDKTLVVTMQRVVLKADKEVPGRWIITSVKDTAAPAGTKSS